MSATHLLAIDQGTTSTRAIVFDARGEPVASHQLEFRQYFPADGWVEHDALEIWRTVESACREALRQAGMKADDIAAIGIANQRETTVLWERASGTPLHHAIVWQDRRTADFCQELKAAGHEARVQEKPACCWIRISPRPSSAGCSTTSRARAHAPSAANSPSAPSTAGCCGSSAAANPTRPTPPMPRARCSSTSSRSSGTTSCSRSSAFRVRCCRR